METLLQYFIEYRYFVIFIGTLVEGEVTLISGGLLVSGGHMSFPVLVLIAILAAVTGDNMFYWVGRRQRSGVRHPFATRFLTFIGEHQLFKGEEFVRRHGGKSVFLIRFFYGLRFAGAMTAGILGMKPRHFFFFNLIGSITWATSISILGILFGNSIKALAQEVKVGEVGLVLLLGGILVIYFLSRRRKKRR